MAFDARKGLYSTREASLLTGLSARQVTGWIAGYSKGGRGPGPLIARAPGDDAAISFLDLIEIVFVNAFLKQGVSMSTIRRASKQAAEELMGDHPFALKRFETDGRAIFERLEVKKTRRKHLRNLVDGQSVFAKVIAPYLIKQIDYMPSGDAMRWWPLGRKAPVLVDPSISFGSPVTASAHVPTSVIHDALRAGETVASIAKWFDIPRKDVKAAADFEQRMAA